MSTASGDLRIKETLIQNLERDGIASIPDLMTSEVLASMQRAFSSRLKRLRWNHFDGYQKTEPYRHMVEDILTLEQGFVDSALHPTIKAVLQEYLGPCYQLVESKGWLSNPTRRDFHGWHGDAWYERQSSGTIQSEIKLAIYLTDVQSGAFNYVKGSHQTHHPRQVADHEVDAIPQGRIVEMVGPAGTAFLFDTTGIHRQAVPILEPRQAVFFCYHDPHVRLQEEDVENYRYGPLILNAAFLGNLSPEDQRVLGFGDKRNYVPGYLRTNQYALLQSAFSLAYNVRLQVGVLWQRLAGRIRKHIRA